MFVNRMAFRLTALILLLCLNFTSSGIAPLVIKALATLDGEHEILIRQDDAGTRMILHHGSQRGEFHRHGWGTEVAMLLSGATTEQDHMALFRKGLMTNDGGEVKKWLAATRDGDATGEPCPTHCAMHSPLGCVALAARRFFRERQLLRTPPHLGDASQARLI